MVCRGSSLFVFLFVCACTELELTCVEEPCEPDSSDTAAPDGDESDTPDDEKSDAPDGDESDAPDDDTASVVIAQLDESFSGYSLGICGTREEAADSKYACLSSFCTCFDFDANGQLVDPSTGMPAAVERLCSSTTTLPNADWQFDYTLWDSPGCTGSVLNPPDGDITCYDDANLALMVNPNQSFEALTPGTNENQLWCLLPAPTGPFCLASRNLILSSNAHVNGDIADNGTGTPTPITLLDVGAVLTGSIVSVPGVSLATGAQVSGDVTSSGAILSSGTIGGTTSPNTPISLPPLPTLPPFPSNPTAMVNAGIGQTLPVTPGNYAQVSANGGTLVFSDGDYFISNLSLNSGTALVTPGTRLFVGSSFNYGFSFTNSSMQPQPILVGYYPTTTPNLNASFQGTLIAPNTFLSFSNPSAVHSGEFYAIDIIVNSGTTPLTCTDGPDL